MSIPSNNPDRGFQFPGEFELTVMGVADAELETLISTLLQTAGLTLAAAPRRRRMSSGGHFVSLSVSIMADTRAQYEAAHAALRAHPAVKWTL